MARYRRRDQKERRLAESLEDDGRRYTVDLVAKRATGVEGYRLTLLFTEVDGPENHIVQLDPADTRQDVARRADELSSSPDRLRELLRRHREEEEG